jgi:sec1 family domain-containing protein 1
MIARRTLPLKDRQRAVVEKALQSPVKLEYAGGGGGGDGGGGGQVSQAPWQVLVADSFARDMLSALLSARDLRRHGFTLHTQIDAPRGAVPDAPATYLVAPTPENVAWLLKDIQTRHLYERVSLAFTSAASRPLLAALGAQLTVPSPVARVLDLHTNFVSLEQNMFSLAMRDSFVRVKSIDDDDALDHFVQPIVSGLLSVCVTLGLVPIIRAQRGGPAAAVATALDDAVREHLDLFQRDSSASVSTFRRPLLLLLDRDFDLNAMLYHTWTYQALVYDSFPTKLNTVTLPASGARYELDKGGDAFWAEKASAPFPEVAEGIEAALALYRNDVESINRRAGGEGAAAANGPSTSALAAAVASLPELAERKHSIDVHTTIATAVLEEIEARALDTFFELESQILAATAPPGGSSSASAADYKVALLELLRGVRETATGDKRGAGTAHDRLRLFLIFYLAFGAQLTEEEMALFRSALSAAGAPMGAVRYVQKVRGFQHDLVTAPSTRQQQAAGVGSKRALLKGIMTNVVSRGYRGIASVAQNAKDLIVESRRSLASAAILKLFVSDRARVAHGGSANDVLDGYLLFDPKVEKGRGEAGSDTTRRMVFSDAILFMVGGGNYVEYEDCMSAVRVPPGCGEAPNLVYGATEVVSGRQFVEQLAAAQEAAAAAHRL